MTTTTDRTTDTDTDTDTNTKPARAELAAARHWHSVSELLDTRADLQGVHPLADLIYDAVRWSA